MNHDNIGLSDRVRTRRLAVMAAIADAPGGYLHTDAIRRAAAHAAGDRATHHAWPNDDLSHLSWFRLVRHDGPLTAWELTVKGRTALALAREGEG